MSFEDFYRNRLEEVGESLSAALIDLADEDEGAFDFLHSCLEEYEVEFPLDSDDEHYE